MHKPDIETIWKSAGTAEEKIPGVAETAVAYRNRSKNLVDRIIRTAMKEHYTFLVVAALVIIFALVSGYYYVAGGVALFAGLMVWKYRAEMRIVNRIQVQEDTRSYLENVRDLMRWFMKVYRIGFSILMPVSGVLGMAISYHLQGKSLFEELTGSTVLLVVVIASALGILFSFIWLRVWVHTLYGRKMQEMDRLIEGLAAERA
ncbi:MAG: hypothetical protein WBB45_21130 [Cyclobacteriaceae bacterium]